MVARLAEVRLDDGNTDFQPSNLEITGIQTDSTAFNVIPGAAWARFNVRYNDYWSPTSLNALLRRVIS